MRKKFYVYSVLALAMLMVSAVFTACGDDEKDNSEKNFTDIAVTGIASNITFSSATISGYVNLPDEMKLLMGTTLKIGIELSKNELMNSPTKYETKTLDGNRSFSIELKNLIPMTTYYYRTFVDNGGIPVYGKTSSFNTLDVERFSSTERVVDNTPFTVTIASNISSIDTDDKSWGILYSKEKEYLTEEKMGNQYSVSGVYSASAYAVQNGDYQFELKNLTPNTTYYYCCYYKYSVGGYIYRTLGEVRSFTTPSVYDFCIESSQTKLVSSCWNSGYGYTKNNCWAQVAFNLKFKRNNTYLRGYGISISKTKNIDEQGRLIDYYKCLPVNSVLEVYRQNIFPSGLGGIFPLFTENGTLPKEIEERLVYGQKYYYQVYYLLSDYTSGNDKTYKSDNYAFEPVKEFIAGDDPGFKFSTGATDLGLSVKWKGCNVGASSPEEKGSRYAWGETEEKEEYTLSNYAFTNRNIGTNICGTKYDVARAELGGEWRMPSYQECQELFSYYSMYYRIDSGKCTKCDYIPYIYNGIQGIIVFSYNGNAIFLPGLGSDKDKYWSGSSGTNLSPYVFGSYGGVYNSSTSYNGNLVRPVTD